MTKTSRSNFKPIQSITMTLSLLGAFLTFSGPASASDVTPEVKQLIMTGQYSKALYQIARIPPDQRSVVQALQMATCYQHLEQYDEAVHILDSLDDRTQARLDVVLQYVDIEYAQTNYQSAVTRLRAVADQFATNPDYVLRYAQLQQALGNLESAETAYRYHGVLREAVQGSQQ